MPVPQTSGSLPHIRAVQLFLLTASVHVFKFASFLERLFNESSSN